MPRRRRLESAAAWRLPHAGRPELDEVRRGSRVVRRGRSSAAASSCPVTGELTLVRWECIEALPSTWTNALSRVTSLAREPGVSPVGGAYLMSSQGTTWRLLPVRRHAVDTTCRWQTGHSEASRSKERWRDVERVPPATGARHRYLARGEVPNVRGGMGAVEDCPPVLPRQPLACVQHSFTVCANLQPCKPMAPIASNTISDAGAHFAPPFASTERASAMARSRAWAACW